MAQAGFTSTWTTLTSTHLIKLGSFKCPKQTLVLFGVLVLMSIGLFYSTRDKKNKNNKNEKSEDDDKKN